MNRSSISTDILNRMKAFESSDSKNRLSSESDDFNRLEADRLEEGCSSSDDGEEKQRKSKMMMSTPPPGVQTDAEGLILPKKIINPCLESTDRKQLHRELKFTTKMGISVLNQKSELQKAYEKQREKQQQQQLQQQQQNEPHSPTFGLKGELNRVIMERAQKYEQAAAAARQQDSENDDDKQYVNPEYLNVRAKLKTGPRTDLK